MDVCEQCWVVGGGHSSWCSRLQPSEIGVNSGASLRCAKCDPAAFNPFCSNCLSSDLATPPQEVGSRDE